MQNATERAENPVEFWEDHYRTKKTDYSGNPGELLVRYVADLTPGRALDIGCSHGDDALWLAGRSWDVTGADISQTAIARAQKRLVGSDFAGRVRFVACNLEREIPDGEYDLITASYFQSPVALARADILRRAAAKLVPGGYFLSIAHASAPPWRKGGDDHEFPGLQEELDAFAPVPGEWTLHKAGNVTRTVTGPEGQVAELSDIVLFFERVDAAG